METPRQCAVVWWFETNQVSTTLLDVLPYQHRVIGAETMISGHKAKVVAICGENESKDAIASMNCMINNKNHLTTTNKPVRQQKKKPENSIRKINSKKEVIDMQMNNKYKCQSAIGEIVPMFQKGKQNKKQIYNNIASFSATHSTSSCAFPFKNELSSTPFNSPPLSSVHSSTESSSIASTAANKLPRRFDFSNVSFASGPAKTPSSNIASIYTPQDTTLRLPVALQIDDSSSLPSVKPNTSTNSHDVFNNQSPQVFLPSWYSSHHDKVITPITPSGTLHSSPIKSAHSLSTFTDLDSWRQSCAMNSKCVPSTNSSTCSSVTLHDNNTDNAINDTNDECAEIDSQDNSNSLPTSVSSHQQMDENQKENMKKLCSTLGVTKENLQFLQNICNMFKQYLDEKNQDTIQQSVDNIVVIGPEYFQADENRVEIFPGGGFYMPSNIWNLICLTHGPDYTNWKSFVRDVLLHVYDDKISNYTAKGKRGRPSIDAKLLKSLFKKINETRSRQEQLPENAFIQYINHSIANKRNYQMHKINKKPMKAIEKN